MRIEASILQELTEAVLVLDGAHRPVLANPAFYSMLQIGAGALEGKTLHELITDEQYRRSLRPVLEAVVAHERDARDVEVVCTVPPRTHKVLSVSARYVKADGGAEEMVLVEVQDITREKETERRVQELNTALQRHGIHLEEINKELESFTHSVSHDLRTPLRFTNKIAHLLLRDHGAELPQGAIEKIHMILDSSQGMGKLIEDLLTFSQVSREPLRRRRVDLARLVRESLAELRDDYQGRVVDVVVDELPPCQADRTLLKQVFLNLLANAIKFTRPCESAEVRVGSRQDAGETVYFVQDNGVGFDMDQSSSMFLAFHRLHTTDRFEGSGIGLALCRRIIERHGGRIWGESQVKQGSTFCFTIGN
jgi:signal transduction histidine kinase